MNPPISLPQGKAPLAYQTDAKGSRTPVVIDMEWMRAFNDMAAAIKDLQARVTALEP